MMIAYLSLLVAAFSLFSLIAMSFLYKAMNEYKIYSANGVRIGSFLLLVLGRAAVFFAILSLAMCVTWILRFYL